MKHLSFLLITFLAWAGIGFAQNAGGPDAYGYTWKNSYHTTNPPSYSWFDITTIGTQVTGLADDNTVGPINLPAGFHFYWYDVDQFWIGSNGYLSFDGDNISSPFPGSIPIAAGANNWIAPLLSDLNFSGAGNPATCYYYIGGDTLCVSYHNVPFWINASPPYTGSNTFQIIFNKADSSITFNYQSTSMGNNTTLDAAVGIENNTGTVGLQVLTDSLPPGNFSIKFYYPPVVTFSVTDGGVAWNNNNKNGGIFLARQGAPITLQSNIRNFGNQNLGAFTALDTVYGPTGIAVTTGSAAIPGLQVGQDTVVTYSNSFSGATAGTYTFRGAVGGISGDLVPTNNTLDQEIVVVDTSGSMLLEYTDGMPDGTGLSWSGGNGGIGVYFEPPKYPVQVASTQYFITANGATPVGFYAKIYGDDGPNGGPGTLLDSVYVDPVNITTGVYTTVNPDNPLIITSGGVYVVWYMAGSNIALGRDVNPPISRRTFELLGPGWSEYRDMRSEDFLIGMNVVPLAPQANFSVDLSQDPNAKFTDLSTNGPTSWLWEFDHSGAVSTQQNPSFTYSQNGTYHVCLTASNAGGSDSTCQNITISGVGLAPVADFSFDDSNAPTVSFTDQSTGNPTAWHWDFDDGGGGDTSNVANPVYIFTTNGNHNVCLTASNANGASTPVCKNVSITNIGLADVPLRNLRVSPNPASETLRLELLDGTDANWEILDAQGRRVLSGTLTSNQEAIDIQRLAAGIYFLRIEQHGASGEVQWVKE